MTPYITDSDLTLYQGDALEVLRTLPDESVHMCVTSPPFYGLRDYQCEGQIGLEPTPGEWCAKLVEVFREVRRVLRSDGTCWVEVGDSYAGTPSGFAGTERNAFGHNSSHRGERAIGRRKIDGEGLKAKDLVGGPWLLAFALRADGWYLRSDIIWSRPNPMPESVTDRPTKSHSYVFLLSKSARYYFGAEAVREKFSPNTHSAGRNSTPGSDDPEAAIRSRNNHSFQAAVGGRHVDHKPPPQTETLDDSEGEAPRGPDGRRATHVKGQDGSLQHRDGERWPNSGRNLRSVWEIATQPYPEAHFATYPEELVRRCILAGTSERGCCPECGAPWVREVETTGASNADNERIAHDGVPGLAPRTSHDRVRSLDGKNYQHVRRATDQFLPSCECGDEQGPIGTVGTEAHSPIPCTVLDPFGGSGTTALVARKHSRRSILIELSEDYCALAAKRLSQLSLLSA